MIAPKVAIVVLNWNGWQDTIECLESLSQISYPNFQVIVVDNGSTDGSVEKIRQWAAGKIPVLSKYFSYEARNKPFNIDILELKENLGYARGNNAGIKHTFSLKDVKYVLILNNDTVVYKDFLSPMVEVFNKYPKAGLVGPKILNYASGSQKQGPLYKRLGVFTILLGYTPLNRFFAKTPIIKQYLVKGIGPQKVYEVTGCCMLFNKEVLERIGSFDENTFLGWEECIIAEKLLKHGYQTYVVPESFIYHKFGQATKKIDPAEKTIAFLRSDKYFQDNYLKIPFIQRVIIDLVRIVLYSLIALANSSYRRKYFGLIRAIIGAP